MAASPFISLWMEQLGDSLSPRPALTGDIEADVAIVGAGYTGLWTAYYLKQQLPALRVVVLEAEIAGFGASGRNGGWVIGEVLGEDRLLAGLNPDARALSRKLLHDIPDEVGRVIAREGIDCHYRKGGVLYCAARYPEQEARLRQQLADWRDHGHGEDDYRWLDVAALNSRLRLATPYGAVYSPHVATIQPARLVRGLAECVERLGVQIYEQSRVTHWQPGSLHTAQGRVQARWLVPAVEGYAATLPPFGQYQLPVQSLIIATEPLSDALWEEIGLRHGEAFSENSRQVSYGQRSRDNRLVFGARGGYRFGGKLRQDFTLTADEIALRRQLMVELFPMLATARISHGWGGNLGVARRFQPYMVCDASQGLAWAGGYGGEGVGASNLAGRTLADLMLGRDTLLTRQPWVRQPGSLSRWEPEPLRWLGYNAIIRSFVREDRTLNNPSSAPWRRRLAMHVASCMEGLMQ
ncbi:FAD-binding oxidoreductase [Aquitalea sp. LB_tupeE]|uniref:NAD(P)/FAD-dependent oxidoreductase n=1 Tax=Aquitalea sp. LB_tupeE TaxID=2748078 RepID=UPI0015BFC62F|nr:FAD-dependent oxidoreductase [Aquitalea sp. LB_tupeE]NWK77675.1 FAD-dependent oxidoreductase [Aquitalea sp. LB_tupeE]